MDLYQRQEYNMGTILLQLHDIEDCIKHATAVRTTYSKNC